MSKTVICKVGPIENVDLCNIKCPICGHIMEIVSWNEPNVERNARLINEPSSIKHGTTIPVYYENRSARQELGLACTVCQSELNIKYDSEHYTREVIIG